MDILVITANNKGVIYRNQEIIIIDDLINLNNQNFDYVFSSLNINLSGFSENNKWFDIFNQNIEFQDSRGFFHKLNLDSAILEVVYKLKIDLIFPTSIIGDFLRPDNFSRYIFWFDKLYFHEWFLSEGKFMSYTITPFDFSLLNINRLQLQAERIRAREIWYFGPEIEVPEKLSYPVLAKGLNPFSILDKKALLTKRKFNKNFKTIYFLLWLSLGWGSFRAITKLLRTAKEEKIVVKTATLHPSLHFLEHYKKNFTQDLTTTVQILDSLPATNIKKQAKLIVNLLTKDSDLIGWSLKQQKNSYVVVKPRIKNFLTKYYDNIYFTLKKTSNNLYKIILKK